jgi:hypothetical protein
MKMLPWRFLIAVLTPSGRILNFRTQTVCFLTRTDSATKPSSLDLFHSKLCNFHRFHCFINQPLPPPKKTCHSSNARIFPRCYYSDVNLPVFFFQNWQLFTWLQNFPSVMKHEYILSC